MVFSNPTPAFDDGSTSAKSEGLRGIRHEGPAVSFRGLQDRAPIVATLIIKNHRFIPRPRSAVSAPGRADGCAKV
jgi:hypothetical protein